MKNLQEVVEEGIPENSEHNTNSKSNKVDDHLNINSYRRVQNSIGAKNNKIFADLVVLLNKDILR